MYAVVLLLLGITAFVLLFQLSGVLAVMFLLVTLVTVPAVELQRRESATAPEWGTDRESELFGLLRLARAVGVDVTGIALGVAFFLLAIALIVFLTIQHAG